MKKLIYSFTIQLIIAFLFSTVLTAQDYIANAQKTTVKWKGSKVVSGSHEGEIIIKSGSISFSNGLVTAGNIVMDMNSLTVNDLEGGMKSKLEGHLKSDDFFSAEKFPLANFKVLKSEKLNDENIRISGELTIKGQTNPLTFESSMHEHKDFLTFSGTMEVDRSLYDVRYGSGKFFDGLGDRAINDIFTLEFMLYLEH